MRSEGVTGLEGSRIRGSYRNDVVQGQDLELKSIEWSIHGWDKNI